MVGVVVSVLTAAAWGMWGVSPGLVFIFLMVAGRHGMRVQPAISKCWVTVGVLRGIASLHPGKAAEDQLGLSWHCCLGLSLPPPTEILAACSWPQ